MNVRKASVSRILTLLILIFFSLAIVSCRFSPKVPPATDPDTGTTNPDSAEPEEPEISTGRQFTISFPEGVTATKGGKPFQSGSKAYEGQTITLTASGLEEGWEVTGWMLFCREDYQKTFSDSGLTTWKYKVSSSDVEYGDTYYLTFQEKSSDDPVEIRTSGETILPGIHMENGMPHNLVGKEFDRYWSGVVRKTSDGYVSIEKYLLQDTEFPPYDEKYVDILSFFGEASGLRLYYLGTIQVNPYAEVYPVTEEEVVGEMFTFGLKDDPADGKKKLYLKNNLDNNFAGKPKPGDPYIIAIQGNRWYALNLCLVSEDVLEKREQDKKVEAKIASLLQNEFKDWETKSEFDRVLAVHDYIIDTVTWGRVPGRFLDAQTAYGALIQNTCVCQGYARAFKQIMDKMEISSTIVIGNSGFHAWNKVKVDKKWYQIDLTWDDYDGANGIYRLYKNFLKSDATMIETKHYGFSDTEPCDEDYPLPWEKKTE